MFRWCCRNSQAQASGTARSQVWQRRSFPRRAKIERMPSPFNHDHIRRSFGRAASDYTAAAVLQHEVEARLLERLDDMSITPHRILDVGAGPGSGSLALKKRFRKADIIALDLALPMAHMAKRNAGWFRPKYTAVCGDAAQLPFADGAFDLVFSNLCMQWIPDVPALFSQWRRILAPGGLLLCSSFGPETLWELRDAFGKADGDASHVNHFAPMQALGDAMLYEGFRDPVLDTDRFTLTYAHAADLMRELRSIGAGNALSNRRRSLTGKSRMQAAFTAYETHRRADGTLPATYEVLYAHGFAPEPGQPRRDGGMDIASVPLAKIPIRRKSD